MAIRNRIAHPRYMRHTRHDRCDRCSAAAQMRALLPTGNELFFCGHHARQHEPRLREIGADLSAGS